MNNVGDYIRQLIAKAEIQEALKELTKIVEFDQNLSDEAVLLRSRYNELRHNDLSGLLSYEEVDMGRNKIIKATLNLLNLWEENNGMALYLIHQNKKQQATFLDLGNCGLQSIPEQIGECTWLKKLSLGEGWYEEESGQLTWKATENQGRKNEIAVLPISLSRLTNLTHLWIVGDNNDRYPINNIEAVQGLSNLQVFYCESSQIVSLSPLVELTKLEHLSCAFTLIADLKPIEGLTSLRKINLNSTDISDLNPISEHIHLTEVTISKTQIRDLSPLAALKSLSQLDCSSNPKITNLIPLGSLGNLTKLDLSHTNVSDLKPLSGLKKLAELSIDNTNVLDLNPLSKLSKLIKFSFSNTKVANIIALDGLKKIEHLNCAYTEVETLENITDLASLASINCEFTKIKRLKPFSLFPALREFSVIGCEIEDCPTDVWESGDARQLRTYFTKTEVNHSISDSKDFNLKENNRRDVKLILLGNSASGKTSLIHYLKDGTFLKDRSTTHGLDVLRWLPDKKRFPLLQDVTVSIWDFGGQEYYHGAYRLFLSSNAIYLLVWDLETDFNGQRKTLLKDGEEKVNLEHFEKQYWLDTIRHYGGQETTTPLLVVQNKTDETYISKKRISQQLHEQYNIQESFHISLLNGCKNDRSRASRLLRHFSEELEQTLISKADEVTSPVEWEAIRQKLLELASKTRPRKNPFVGMWRKNNIWITLDDFKNACGKIIDRPLDNDEIYTIPRWLEKGGVIAFFPENDNLEDKLFFSPNTLANKIYKMLSTGVLRNSGVFNINDVSSDEKDEMINIFIEVAQQLELIFPNPEPEQTDSFIAPQYLPESHLIEDLFKIASHGAWQAAFWIKIPIFYYKRLLHGLILHYIADKDTEARHFWKHGIVFIKNKTRVLLKGLYPEEKEYDGKLLIGVEKTNEDIQRSIQHEVFFKCLELLLSHKRFNSTIKVPSTASKEVANSAWKEEVRRMLLKEGDKTINQQLALIEVSADGENYVRYIDLLNHNKLGETRILNLAREKYILLKSFGPILPVTPKRTKRVFLSYSHKNANWLNRLRVHLSGLRRAKEIETWTDQEILPGESWDAAIRDNLASADVFILLLSADFIASEYIWKVELPEIFKRLREKKAIIVPILTEPHDLSGLPMISQTEDGKPQKLSDFEIVPKDENGFLRPISLWANPEEALAKVASIIRESVLSNVY